MWRQLADSFAIVRLDRNVPSREYGGPYTRLYQNPFGELRVFLKCPISCPDTSTVVFLISNEAVLSTSSSRSYPYLPLLFFDHYLSTYLCDHSKLFSRSRHCHNKEKENGWPHPPTAERKTCTYSNVLKMAE